jgi:VanZ family protein
MVKKRIPTGRIILWIVTALVLIFVFVQSVLPEAVSAEESGWFRTHIMTPLCRLFGIQTPSQRTVRKLAHVFEFTVLAALLVPSFSGSLSKGLQGGFAAAFLDESIQLLSGRGGQLQDVWIDLIGIALGALLGWILYRLSRRCMRSKQSNL